MTIRIWQQFSPNNSSACRIVARFEDPRAARETAAELARFLIDHIRENRGQWNEGPVLAAFAAKYGLPAARVLDWSSHLHEEDEPEIAVDDRVLVVYHHYCQGFEHLVPMLQAKGAIADEKCERPMLSLLFRRVASIDLDFELAIVFDHINAQGTRRPSFRAPWAIRAEPFERATYFRDAGTVGLWFPCEPHGVPMLEGWLARHGVTHASLQWCEDGDEARFRAIAKARCTACGGALEYLDPRIHDIETPQLVCRPCGGFYDLATYDRQTP